MWRKPLFIQHSLWITIVIHNILLSFFCCFFVFEFLLWFFFKSIFVDFIFSKKMGFDTSCKLIKWAKASSWCSNGSLISALAETCKTSLFNTSFNVFILDLVIGPFRTCNRYLLVFVGWSTSIMVTRKP